MRQAGVLAAAGLLALREGPARLINDHENAAHLARGLASIEGIEIDPKTVVTNILVFKSTPPSPAATPRSSAPPWPKKACSAPR